MTLLGLVSQEATPATGELSFAEHTHPRTRVRAQNTHAHARTQNTRTHARTDTIPASAAVFLLLFCLSVCSLFNC